MAQRVMPTIRLCTLEGPGSTTPTAPSLSILPLALAQQPVGTFAEKLKKVRTHTAAFEERQHCQVQSQQVRPRRRTTKW